MTKRRFWTEEEDDYLRKVYGNTPMEELERCLQRTRNSIWNRAQTLHLRKSVAFMQQIGATNSQSPNAIAHRFQKGHVPANKGDRHWYRNLASTARAKMQRTQFKKGRVSSNTKPVGYESIHQDGYVYIKVESHKRMVLKSRYVWELHNGPIPKGMCIGFRDGNRLNCDISNLEMFSETEKARRVTSALSEAQIRQRIEKATVTRNKTIARDKMLIRWGFEPKSKLVKKYYPVEVKK